jgi:hypothetical protein
MGSERHQLRQPAREAPVVRFVPQRPIEPRRRHFQRVGLTERRLFQVLFLDVEQRAQVVADPLAFFDADGVLRRLGHAAIRPIDDDPQHRADRLAPQLDVENLEAVPARHALGRLAHPRQFRALHPLREPCQRTENVP